MDCPYAMFSGDAQFCANPDLNLNEYVKT